MPTTQPSDSKQSSDSEQSPILFSPGKILAAPGAVSFMKRKKISPQQLIARHIRGDWGTVFREDGKSNDNAVINGNYSIHSVYPFGKKSIWIITEWDRSVTTILLPEEY